MQKLILCLMVSLLAGALPAMADIPNYELNKRFAENPNTYDTVDKYCDGKKPDEACTIPGDKLAGGGEGACRRNALRYEGIIEMRRTLSSNVLIDRAIQPASPSNCPAGSPKGEIKDGMIACGEVKFWQVDRFCSSKKLHERCVADVNLEGKAGQFNGSCEMGATYEHGRYSGDFSILCQSPTQLDAKTHKVGILQKLGQ